MRSGSRHFTPVAAVALLALVVPACGGGDKKSAGKSASSGSKAAAVSIRESEFSLNPANPKVAKGKAVLFKVRNQGQDTHALEVEGPNGEARTRSIASGSSATLKVDLSKPGTYKFYCPIDGHRKLGMAGQVTVAGGAKSGSSSGGTGGGQAPPSSGGGGGGY